MGISFKSIFKAVVATAVAVAGVALAFPSLIPAGISAAATAAGISPALYFGAISGLLTGASALVSSLLAGSPPEFEVSQAIRGQLVTTRRPDEAARIVYGQTRLGGNQVFVQTTGSTNQTMYQCIAIAGHELNALVKAYANDDELVLSNQGTYYTTSYKSNGSVITLAWMPGTDTQSANPLLTGTDAANYQFKGIATLITKLEYNQDVFVNGVPNFTVVVQGKKVFDPRTDTTSYSNNAALCIYDYLTNTDYGLGADADEVDSASFITAANICDQNVDLLAGGTEKRYTINGAFSTSETPKAILQKLLTACGGKLTYVGGKWVLKVAAYSSPTITLDEDDIVSEITMQASQSRRDIFNAVKGVYSEPDFLYQPVSFPPVRNATYESEDGEVIWKDASFPFTTSFATCQRLAKIELEKARQQIAVNLSCNLKGFALQPGDTVYLNFARYGWTNKIFEVLTWEFSFTDSDSGPTPVVNLMLRETASSIYDWSEEETEIDIAPNSTLPNPWNISAPSGLQLTQIQQILSDGSTSTALLVEWVAPTSSFIKQYEVQWRRSSDYLDYGLITNAADDTQNYGLITSSADNTFDYGSIEDTPAAADPDFNSTIVQNTQFTIPNIIPNASYTVRVRAINSLDIRSEWTSTTNTPTPDTTPPGDISGVIATGGFRQVSLSWINPIAADLDVIEIYRNNTNNLAGSTKIAITRSSTYIDTGLGINVLWYYWLRPLDRTGNAGNFTSSVNATTSFIDVPDFSEEVMNLFSESGAYGIEPVASLPATGDFDGQIKFNTTEVKLYRWNANSSPPEWTDDIFSITSGSVDLASFAAGIEPVAIESSLPNPSGYTGAKIVFLTTDNKLYRYTGSAWTTSILASDLSGTLADTNFPTDLRPIELVNTLPTTGNYAGRTVFLTTDNKIYRHNGTIYTAAVATSDLSGTITDGQISDLAATKLTGQITSTQITDNSVTTAKINAGAVIAGKIASGAIEADKIASGAITADKISAGAVQAAAIASSAIEADKIAAGAITAGKIAAGAVSTTALAASAVTSDKILAGSIQGDRIAANTITGGLIAASGIITSAAQINDSVITNAKIVNAAITTAKIGDSQITTAKIADAQITNAKLGDASISTAKIQDAQITNAKIGTAAVDTLQVAGNAITIPSSAYTSGSIDIGYSTTVQQVTWTSTNAPTFVLGSFVAGGDISGTGYFSIELYVDGSLLRSDTFSVTDSEPVMVTTNYSFTPSSGSRTIYLKSSSGLSGAAVSSRSLFVIETKR